MKIDKIVFSSSELFSPFWNIQSRIWKTKLGIEPVCLFYGDRKKCNLSEEYGQIIEMKFDPSLPEIIQIQFSKFFHPTTEPNTTWITGDIDRIPLQKEHFLDGMNLVPDEAYCHLSYSMISQMWGVPNSLFFARGSRRTGGFDFPAHNHCAKGSTYNKMFFNGRTFDEVVRQVVNSKQYGMIGAFKNEMNIRGDYWVAEETYTSEMLWKYFKNVSFQNLYLKEYSIFNILEGKCGGLSGSAYPLGWDGSKYVYDENKLKSKGYIEIHCPLDYKKQEESLMKVLSQVEMI